MTSTTTIEQNTSPVPPKEGDLEPFMVTRKQLNGRLFNSPSLVRQLIAARWILPVRPGKPGREALYDFQSVKKAFERLKAGEEPQPLLKTVNNQSEEQA